MAVLNFFLKNLSSEKLKEKPNVQDPEVVMAPLPVFHRPQSTTRWDSQSKIVQCFVFCVTEDREKLSQPSDKNHCSFKAMTTHCCPPSEPRMMKIKKNIQINNI